MSRVYLFGALYEFTLFLCGLLFGDKEKMLKLDLEFHEMIIKHSKNQYLIEVYASLRPRIIFFLRFVVKKPSYLSIYQRHKGICTAIVERKEDLAAERLIKHLSVSLSKSFI